MKSEVNSKTNNNGKQEDKMSAPNSSSNKYNKSFLLEDNNLYLK